MPCSEACRCEGCENQGHGNDDPEPPLEPENSLEQALSGEQDPLPDLNSFKGDGLPPPNPHLHLEKSIDDLAKFIN